MGDDRYMCRSSSLLSATTGVIYIVAPIIVSIFFNIPSFAGV